MCEKRLVSLHLMLLVLISFLSVCLLAVAGPGQGDGGEQLAVSVQEDGGEEEQLAEVVLGHQVLGYIEV